MMTGAHRVAVLGCGYWGQNLVRNFHALGALAAVADVSPHGRATAARIAPGVAIHDRLDAALDDRSIAGVVISTPAETHAELTERALAAGKDVLCEKPLALHYDAARRVRDLALRRGRVLMVGHLLEYHPAIERLRGLVASGQLGRIRYLYSNRTNLGKVRREENILWSFAPHDIAVILRLVGALPCQVIAAGGAYLQADIADVTVTQLLFDSGVAAHVFVSWLNPFKEQKLVVVGSERMATFDDVRRELVLHDQHVVLQDGEPVPVKGAGAAIAYPDDEPLRIECQAFLAAIASRTPPLTDGASALRVLRVLEAAQRSLSARGQPMALAPE
ncbi:MAG TPA: Gfo/Idh/MocA family oxidoreductase [Kofleriaceae bacterium]|jgi:predicted dehydrogenase|nr:Gfo/Idh/MocA family oxidoreductase [Kofleriaceae bacterium]